MSYIVDYQFPILFGKDAAFLNTIEAMKTLAVEDFEGITPLRTFRTETYPQPAISLTSPAFTGFKREYAIYGLLMAFGHIHLLGVAQVTHFTLLWNMQPVGGILFGDINRFAQELDQRTNATTKDIAELTATIKQIETGTNQTDITSSVTHTLTSNLTDLSSTNLYVAFHYFGDTIAKVDMMISIMYVLVQAARRPANRRILGPWGPAIQDENCKFDARSLVSNPPPFFTFYCVIQAVAAAANFLFERNIYRELSGLIRLDEVTVGKVVLQASPAIIETS
ncbi:MAG: hypothetical protein Q9225_006105 [Loekoesia sp. 1 TL-2023]